MKNKSFTAICLILTFLIIINLSLSFCKVTSAVNMNMKEKVIVIDPGHGGEDGGTVAFDGTNEKEINLNISLKLKKLFENNGFKVIMTRAEDADLGDKNLNTVKERKKSDIINRTKICNTSKADLILSIHQNFFEDPKYYGAQMFYGKHTESKNLALYLQNEIKSTLQPTNKREIKEGKGIYILENSSLPIVLIECGFMSNHDELLKLKDENYTNKLSIAIYTGVCKYLNSLS